MLMKIVTYVAIALLVVVLGAAAFFYITTYKPMYTDYVRMKAGMPELDKAKADLKKYKEKESKETAWLNPAVEVFSTGLGDDIKAGTVEVFSAGNKVIVNIAEDALYMPGSYTFSKESPPLRLKLITLLRKSELKGKEITIGNTTQAVPAQGKGRKKTPAKDARTLAAERSAALIKDFEKNEVDKDALIAAAFSAKQPEIGAKIKANKTVIIMETPPAAPPVAVSQEPAKEITTKTSSTAQPAPKGIPIQPAQPKAN
jgi:hypothetical protein